MELAGCYLRLLLLLLVVMMMEWVVSGQCGYAASVHIELLTVVVVVVVGEKSRH